MHIFLLWLFWCGHVVLPRAQTLQVVGRRQQILAQFVIDIQKKSMHKTQTLLNRFDENNRVLLDVDAQTQTIAYVESLSKLYHDQVHLISTNHLTKASSTLQRNNNMQPDELITALSVDWITKKVYLSTERPNTRQSARIEACNFNKWIHSESSKGADCVIIIHRELDSLHSLVVDPVDGMFDKTETDIVTCTLHQRSSCRLLLQNTHATQLAVFQKFLFWSSLELSKNNLQYCQHAKCNQTISKIQNSDVLEAFKIADMSVQPNRTNPNPCSENNGNCSHFCLLTPGAPWRACACPIGIRLLNDQLTCDPCGLQRILLVGSTDGLYFVSLDTQDFLPQRIPYQNWTDNKQSQKIVDVDYDPIESLIYWIDQEAQKIRRCKLDGTELMDLPISKEEASEASQLAIDPVGRNLIWLNSKNGRIELMSLQSNLWSRKALISTQLQYSQKLVVDTQTNRLYFSSIQNGVSVIERSNLDGSQRESVMQFHGPEWISSLLIDGSRLFWTDRESSSLLSVDLNGDLTNVQMLAQHLNNPNSIAKSGQTMFYISLGGRSLHTINLSPSSFAFTSSTRSRTYRLSHLRSTCLRSNGGCEHICVPILNGNHRCLCASGYELHANNRSCVLPPDFLVYSSLDSPNDLLRLSTQGPIASTQNERQMNVPNVSSTPIALALNPLTKQIIFCTNTDGQYSSNARLILTNFNGTKGDTLLEDRALKSLKGLDVDWASGNIYWSNGQLKRIQVLQINERKQKTIAWERIDPRQIAVDTLNERFFFVDCYNQEQNGHCSIKKCPLASCLNGGEVFVPRVQVQSMTLDSNAGLLFWSNGRQIWSVELESQFQRSHLADEQSPIDSLAAHSGYLFFANKTDGTIRRIRQLTPLTSTDTLHKNVGNVQTMLIAHSSTKKLSSHVQISLRECQLKSTKSGCLCIPRQKVYTCECPDQEEINVKNGKCTPPTKFALMALRDQFVRFTNSFENVYAKEPYQILPINNVGAPISIAFDLLSLKRYVYWIDAFDRDGADVKRAASDIQSNVEYLNLAQNTHCSQFYDIVIDSFGHQLFASCSKSQNEPNAFVHVWRINPDDKLHYLGFVVDGNQKSTVTRTYPSPRRLAVFNQLKALFYVDENPSLDSPVIVRCTLEGRHLLIPFSGLLNKQNQEQSNNYAQIHNIAPVDDKSILFTATNQAGEELLYLLANNESVYRINNLKPLQWANSEMLRRRSELIVVGTWSSFGHLPPNRSNFACLNATCSHLCVASHMAQSRQFECLCPSGYSRSVSDETRCQLNIQCQPWQFACQNGFECINAALKCDKIADCFDDSDENPLRCNLIDPSKEEKHSKLETTSWVCDDRLMLIPKHQLCDGRIDCGDASDESHCRCPDPELNFDCNAWDHIRRSPDNDESNTQSQCILRSLLCDGRAQCLNVADELPQICKHHPNEKRIFWSESHWLFPSVRNWCTACYISVCKFVVVLVLLTDGVIRRDDTGDADATPKTLPSFLYTSDAFDLHKQLLSHQTPLILKAHLFQISILTIQRVWSKLLCSRFPHNNSYNEMCPIYESATLPHKRPPLHSYNSLPWTHNQLNYWQNPSYEMLFYEEGAGEAMATPSNAPSSSFALPLPHHMHNQRFHAPPPSAASISTYGIAKPVGIRYTFSRPSNQRTSTTSSSSSENSAIRKQRRLKRRRKRQRQAVDQPQNAPRSHTENSSEPLPPPPPYTTNDL
ncbi:Low-density lipoprotein receptor repeat class B containing protein [Aphelenchoides bicaudatus]|nr:Low-density lipoprotein receptor repeat class B containing protein [Aphelenchoides bicaudatus]